MKKLREKLNAKLSRNGGFTLVEMLIVVAIIAILIAVSIPLVNNALERARHATDAANERAAKAEILIEYLAGDASLTEGTVYIYDAVEGKIDTTAASSTYGQHKDNDGKVLAIKYSEADGVQMQWVTNGASDTVTGGTWASGICSVKDVDHT